jgi:2-(1,2-epoxy-1,2-dihydrophenyl)acetyl-CoA isomerase
MAGSKQSTVRLDRDGRLATIWLSCPDGAHTIGEDFPEQLGAALDEVAGDREVRASLLCGDSKVFCAGADLNLAERLREPEFGRRWLETQHAALLRLARLRMPVVAAVDRAAFGAGFNLALACDFIVASVRASFCQAFVKVGLATDMGSPYLLPRRVGLQRARELMYTGRTLDAAEAHEIGVVDELVESDARQRATELADELAEGPPMALEAMKTALGRAFAPSLEQVLDDELEVQIPVLRSEDFGEGATAFKEKRRPKFRGR